MCQAPGLGLISPIPKRQRTMHLTRIFGGGGRSSSVRSVMFIVATTHEVLPSSLGAAYKQTSAPTDNRRCPTEDEHMPLLLSLADSAKRMTVRDSGVRSARARR